MSNPASIRKRAERLRGDLARAEGERDTLDGEIEAELKRLRKILGCKKGQERESVRDLKERIEADEEEAIRLLDLAEAIRDGEEE